MMKWDWLIDNAPWLLLAFAVLGAVLHAENAEADTNLYVGAWSEHLISGEDLNERHDLIALEHNDWIAGTFENSYSREMWFVGHKWSWEYEGLSAGVYGGAMKGYRKCYGDDSSNGDVCPLVAPYVTYDAPIAPQVMLIGEALAVTIKIRL